MNNGTKYSGVVDGMTKSEADAVLAYATSQYGVWADFVVYERTVAKPGFPAGWAIDYRTKIEFRPGQAIEVKSGLTGYLHGWRGHS